MTSLGDITVGFKADTSSLMAGFNMLRQGFGGLPGIVAIGVGAVVGIGVAATKMAGDFQESMTTLLTGAGEAESNLGMVGDGIKQLAIDTGTSTQQLISGMFMIESAGYHGAAGLNVLKVAAEGARVGNADLGVVANTLTTILHDYHMNASQTADAMNGLTATVQSGKMHLQDLATSMGSVLPLASALGLSFPQVAGAIAEMTNSGMSAQRASMNLANAIRSLAAPGSAAQKAMQGVGLSAQDLKNTLSTQGLAGAIQVIEEHVSKTFPAGSVAAVEAFKKIMGGATGYNVSLMLGGKNMADYESNIAKITAAMKSGSGAVTGWALVQQDFNFKMDQAKQALSVFMITVGSALLPVLTKLLDVVSPLITGFVEWTSSSKGLQGILKMVGDAFQSVFDPVQKVQTAVKPLLDSFDRGRGIFESAMQAAQPLVDTFDRAHGVIAATTQVIKPLTDSFDRASSVTADMTKHVSGVHQAASPLVSLFQGIATAIKVAVTVFQTISTVVKDVIGFFQVLWKNVLQPLGAFLVATFAPVWKQLQDLWKQILPLFKQLWDALQPLLPIFGGLAAIIIGGFIGALEGIIKTLAVVIGDVTSFVGGVVQAFTGLVQIISGVLRIFVDLVTFNFSDMGDAIKQVWNGIKNFFGGLFQAIGSLFHAFFGGIIAFVGGFIQGIVGFFQHLYDVIVGHSLIPDLVNGIITWFEQLPSKLLQIGANMIQGLISGIFSMAGNLASAIGTTIHNAVGNIPGLGGVLSNLHILGYASGGPVMQTGLALVHQGEYVIPAGGSVPSGRSLGSGGGGTHITEIYLDGLKIAQVVAPHMDALVRAKFGPRSRL